MTLTEMIHTLQSMRGTIEKTEFIKANADNDDFRSFLYYALNPLLTYKVSEQTLSRPGGYDPKLWMMPRCIRFAVSCQWFLIGMSVSFILSCLQKRFVSA